MHPLPWHWGLRRLGRHLWKLWKRAQQAKRRRLYAMDSDNQPAIPLARWLELIEMVCSKIGSQIREYQKTAV